MLYRYLKTVPKMPVELADRAWEYAFRRADMSQNVIVVAGYLTSSQSQQPSGQPRGDYLSTFLVNPAGTSITRVGTPQAIGQYQNAGNRAFHVSASAGLLCRTSPDGSAMGIESYAVMPGATSAAGTKNNNFSHQIWRGVVTAATGAVTWTASTSGNNGPGASYVGFAAANSPRTVYASLRRTIFTPIGDPNYYSEYNDAIGGMYSAGNAGIYNGRNANALEVLSNDKTGQLNQLLVGVANGANSLWDIWQQPAISQFAAMPIYRNVGLPLDVGASLFEGSFHLSFMNNILLFVTRTHARTYSYNGAGTFTPISTREINANGRISVCRLSNNRVLVASLNTGVWFKFDPATGVLSDAGQQVDFPGVAWAATHEASGNVVCVPKTNLLPLTLKIFSVTE